LAALVLATALAPTTASAGAQLPCNDPAVFQGAAVNTFVLPYRFDGVNPSSDLERATRQVSALVHLEVLFSILKYGAVGGTDLVAIPGYPCDVDKVISRVSQRSGSGTLHSGQALVVVWGRIFERGDQLYLQSYVRFLRQGEAGPVQESISVNLIDGDRPLDLTGTLPAQATAFPPRRISKSDLNDIDRKFRSSMVVRKEPRNDAPGRSIDFDPWKVFPYYVTRSSGDWIYIKSMSGGPEGWVRARDQDDGPGSVSLSRLMPELSYVDAVAGFMRLRANESREFRGTPAQVAAWTSAMETRFARYERSEDRIDASSAIGLADAIRGFVLWTGPQPDRAAAARLFSESKSLMPDYGAARNLAAVTSPFRGGVPSLDGPGAARLSKELLGALALAPKDGVVLDNLARLYQAFRDRPVISPFDADELASRVAAVKVARMSAPP
jgi:hypothetical protein